jgi:hypothetical protein
VNPFLQQSATENAAPPHAAASFGNKYGSDSEGEDQVAANPFLARNPFAQPTAAAAPFTASRYDSGDEPFPARMPGSPDFPPPPISGRQSSGPITSWDSPAGSPSGPAGHDEESDNEGEMDPALAKLFRMRELAMELCGGLDVWDDLPDEQMDHFMALARQRLQEQEVDEGSGKYE